jgi:hypothetical protein
LRTQLQRLKNNTGEIDPRLLIEWPKLGLPIWEAFRKMGRPPSMEGVAEITLNEILAYQQLYRVQFSPWELDMLDTFDAIALEVLNKR